MIATLRGEVTQIEDTALVIEVGGVGLRVMVPAPLRARMKVGEAIFIYTHLIVRETELSLYGFESQSERDLFNLLLGVDGVGPKAALSVLSTMNIETVQRAIFGDEPELLSRVPGVGKKTAQKIGLYLKDRLKPVDTLASVAAMSDADSEVLEALIALGYSVVEAQSAVQSIPKDAARCCGGTPAHGVAVFPEIITIAISMHSMWREMTKHPISEETGCFFGFTLMR
jgi:holliday junction DNA helicase RuvA